MLRCAICGVCGAAVLCICCGRAPGAFVVSILSFILLLFGFLSRQLPNVTENILKKVVDFCKQHENDPLELSEEEEIKLRETPIADWDKEFCDVDLQTLFEMILAANFLDFKPMLNLTCKAVAEMIKGKSPEDIKKIFGIEGDFTEEEKAQVLAENPWLKEDNEVEPAAASDAAAAKTE